MNRFAYLSLHFTSYTDDLNFADDIDYYYSYIFDYNAA